MKKFLIVLACLFIGMALITAIPNTADASQKAATKIVKTQTFVAPGQTQTRLVPLSCRPVTTLIRQTRTGTSSGTWGPWVYAGQIDMASNPYYPACLA